jgi:hypothetical protein
MSMFHCRQFQRFQCWLFGALRTIFSQRPPIEHMYRRLWHGLGARNGLRTLSPLNEKKSNIFV